MLCIKSCQCRQNNKHMHVVSVYNLALALTLGFLISTQQQTGRGHMAAAVWSNGFSLIHLICEPMLCWTCFMKHTCVKDTTIVKVSLTLTAPATPLQLPPPPLPSDLSQQPSSIHPNKKPVRAAPAQQSSLTGTPADSNSVVTAALGESTT